MAPVTRSQARSAHGEFCKYVMEQPTIMQLIVSNLEAQPVLVARKSLIRLKTIFKSERCTDVVNTSIAKSLVMHNRYKDFLNVVEIKTTNYNELSKGHFGNKEQAYHISELFEYISANADMLHRNEFREFVGCAIVKLDKLVIKAEAFDKCLVARLLRCRTILSNIVF
jgi:hypothetical protein